MPVLGADRGPGGRRGRLSSPASDPVARTGGQPDARGAAHEDVTARGARPASTAPDVRTRGVLLADDEAERERGERRRRAEVRRAPSSGAPQTAARTARTASSPGSCGSASATAAIPHCARAARTDAAMRPAGCPPAARRRDARPGRARAPSRAAAAARRCRPRRASSDASTTRSHTSSGSTGSDPHRRARSASRRTGRAARRAPRSSTSVPAEARRRTAPSPTRAVRPAKVRASAAARGIGEDQALRTSALNYNAERSTCDSTVTDAHHTAPDDFVPDPDPVASMLAVLDLSQSGARTTEDIFTGVSQSDAARPRLRRPGARAVDRRGRAHDPRRPVACTRCTGTSCGPATRRQGITFSVDRIHDGRSFSTRRTQAFQEGVPIFSMIASFQDEDPGIEHQADDARRRARHPRTCPTSRITSPACIRCPSGCFTDRPLDLRHIPSPIYLSVRGRARAPAGGVDAHATRDPRRPAHCTAPRWPT